MQVDPGAPPILSNVPGSFTWKVLHERHPAIIDQVAAAFPYPPHIRAALDRLRRDAVSGVVEPLPADAHDAADWTRWSAPYLGMSWYDVPFLWAENYFYRRLLDAIGYFRPGPWRGLDPFEPQKNAELADPALDADLAGLARIADLPPDEQLTAAVDAALWGNRADLATRLSDPEAEHRKHASDLVADDSAALHEILAPGTGGTVCLVADNAGRELLPDLALVDVLLHGGRADRVELHLKPLPYFVSDATGRDLLACLHRLAAHEASAPLAGRLRAALGDGRLELAVPGFYCTPLTYAELPGGLAARFRAAKLTVVKGDLHYRRLVGDRHWPAATPFEAVTEGFPGAVAALRTLKSEVLVGVPDAAARDAAGEQWRLNGTHGLIQVRR
ncbi:damage-control phosphatase ARMT1 family protein [Catellatospora bangladeshensis]|uniref:Damage-control phosphatase ARMT1-like metal-binding domain-containing protein n=1 Tax=Catellatospora bangladeshensis TaxID=310355 RepID=A0A8J3JPX4_9ACTN|nr:damage-control phosphatase ARMT1 family protein [Catellatospora bangladeshensis]GIF86414.1 hypothetical protein Cba03nite_77630 [Catellatospora bangladeshensis]